MDYLRSQSVRLSLWKLKILVTGSTFFFSQVKADLCNNLHSLIIIFFFLQQGEIFLVVGWYQRKGGGRMLVRFRR